MKKIAVLLTSIILTSKIYGMTLDDMIEDIKFGGYSREYRILEEKRLEIDEEKIGKINRDGVAVDAASQRTSGDSQSESESTLSAKYDIFKYSAEYNHETGEKESELVGVEKDLKDLFYSEKKYESTLFSYEKKYQLNQEEERMEEEVLSLIELYKNYMDKKLELQLKEKLHPGLEEDLKELKKEYELGTGTEFDYKYAAMNAENSQADIIQLKEDLLKLKKDFNYIFKIDVGQEEIEDFPKLQKLEEQDFKNIGQRDIENNEFLLKQAKENYNYSKYSNKWPDITAGTFYDTVEDQWVVSMELSKDIFGYDDTTALYEVDIETYEMQSEKLSKESQSTVLDLKNQYEALVKEVENLRRENKLNGMKYEIYKLKYEQGSESYINYTEKYDEFLESSIELENQLNELNALIYEIMFRR